jgi:hypothetical protein
MEWLVALLVLLGLGAVAGLVWLHFGRDSAGPTANSSRQSASGQSGGGAEPAELSITVGYLRRRASHYRDMAVKVDDAIAGARCWDLARLLDRAADALESAPEDDPADREG